MSNSSNNNIIYQNNSNIPDHPGLYHSNININIPPIPADEKTCRICNDNRDNDNETLFSFCICRGSLEYIHIDCLQKWIEMRFKNRAERPLQCEICRTEYIVDVVVEYRLGCREKCNLRSVIVGLMYFILLVAITVALIIPLGIFVVVFAAAGLVMFFMGSCYAWFCVPVVTIRRRRDLLPPQQNLEMLPAAIIPVENDVPIVDENVRSSSEESNNQVIIEPGA